MHHVMPCCDWKGLQGARFVTFPGVFFFFFACVFPSLPCVSFRFLSSRLSALPDYSLRFLFPSTPQLVQLQEQLHSADDGPSLEIVRAIQQISRDMHMITFYLRPMKMVASQLITVRCLTLVRSAISAATRHRNQTQ